MESSDILPKLISLGLSEQKAKETLKNVALTKILTSAFSELNQQKKNVADLPKGAGMLIYHLCTKIKAQVMGHLSLLVTLIAADKLDTTLRVDCALDFVLNHGVTNANINVAELEKHCGVGIVVTPE